jgi:hypothetical protein
LDEICKARSPARAVSDPVPDADRVVPATAFPKLGGDIVRQPEGLVKFLHDKSVLYIMKFILAYSSLVLEAYPLQNVKIWFQICISN